MDVEVSSGAPFRYNGGCYDGVAAPSRGNSVSNFVHDCGGVCAWCADWDGDAVSEFIGVICTSHACEYCDARSAGQSSFLGVCNAEYA